MKNPGQVGIHGIGVYLPDQIRTNEFWHDEVTAQWRRTSTNKLDRPEQQECESQATQLVRRMMASLHDDPFKGFRERRVMPDGMSTTDMEIQAAKRALQSAGISVEDIDLLFGTTSLPDHLLASNVCRVHAALDLRPDCAALQVEGVCAGFLLQLSLAESMIRAGRGRYALLVQSSGTTRFHPREDPLSPLMGDGATAVVVGPVDHGFGVVSESAHTYGEFYDAAITPRGPTGHWWESGPLRAHIRDVKRSREMLLRTVEHSAESITAALRGAELNPEDIDFFGCHQGLAWLRQTVQDHLRLKNARSVDTFSWAGSILGANIPLVLHTALKEGLLQEGDRTLLFAGASGVVLRSTILRWGGARRLTLR